MFNRNSALIWNDIMKTTLLFLSVFLSVSLFGQDEVFHRYSDALHFNNNNLQFDNEHSEKSQQTVYVCTGSSAYAYHSYSSCPGLNNCKSPVYPYNESFAVNSLKKIPCCRCWNNVSGRCKDDNPYGSASNGSGGGGGGEAIVVIAAVVVATSVFILSNDIYLSSIFSFKNMNSYDNTIITPGWYAGLRKTFPNSALEYGFGSVGRNYGGNFSYVHNVFETRMPHEIKPFLGPTFNYWGDFGFGGIIGLRRKFFDRLSLDFRYELTSQTNQFMLGLIFTYQKEYFWNKRR